MLKILFAAFHALRPDTILRQVVDDVTPAYGRGINHNKALFDADRAEDWHFCQQLTYFLSIGDFYLPAACGAHKIFDSANGDELTTTNDPYACANLAYLGENMT